MSTPTLEDAKHYLQALPIGDLQRLKTWIILERVPELEAKPQIDKALAEETQRLWEAHPELRPAFDVEPVEFTTTTDGQPVTLDDLLGAYEQWVQPTGAHDSYPPEAIVTDQGRIWRNDLGIFNGFKPEAGNVHTKWTDITDELLAAANPEPEPETETGGEGGEDAPAGAKPAPWEQKQGAHDAYKAGDEITWTDGEVYTATATTTYSPESYPPHWKKN